MRSKKGNLCVLAGIAVAALLAVGCGKGAATNTVSGGGVVSGTPVSGSAASEAAVSGTSVQEDDEVQKGERKLRAADITEQRDGDGIPFVQDETIFYNDSMEGLYRVDLAKWKIIPMGKICDGTMAATGDSVYFRTEGLMKYDAGTGKKEVLIPFEELAEKLENTDAPREHAGKKKTGGEMFDDYNVKNIFLQKDRLYLAVEVSYGVGEEDDDDEGDFAEIMLSCRAEDGSDLRYEKPLTEYLWKHSVPYRDSSGESLWEELTGNYCLQMDDGIVMYFYDEEIPDEKNREWEDHHRYVMYDLRDGTFWNVKKPSDAYGYIKALGHSYYEEAHC
jgi:hypothetical protein